jgi:hypothetical protein
MASTQTITVKATHADIVRDVQLLPSIVTGPLPGPQGLVNILLIRVGLALLARIRYAFEVKASGGTDDAGDTWAPLLPQTIAYKRRHGGVPPPKQRAKYRPSWMLSAKERKAWWTIYGAQLARLRGKRGRYARIDDEMKDKQADKGHAAAIAWVILKASGARTLLSVYGNAPVKILRDTDVLYNSLSPGVGAASAAATVPSSPNQVFRLAQGEVILGTNRKGAAAHHAGIPGRLPQRRLWPHPSRWPAPWWLDALFTLREGIIDIAIQLFSRHP